MRVNHDPHISQTGKGHKASETLTPREIDFLKALDGLQAEGRRGTLTELCAWLRIVNSSVCCLRDKVIARGAVKSTGYGSTRQLTLTDLGREAISE